MYNPFKVAPDFSACVQKVKNLFDLKKKCKTELKNKTKRQQQQLSQFQTFEQEK